MNRGQLLRPGDPRIDPELVPPRAWPFGLPRGLAAGVTLDIAKRARTVSAALPEDDDLPPVTGAPVRKVTKREPHKLPMPNTNARRIYDYLLRQQIPAEAGDIAAALRLNSKRVRPALSNLRSRGLAVSSGKMPYMVWRAVAK